MADRATLNPALRDFWPKACRNRVLYGGRASSKSWDAAGFAIYLANTYRLRICCARQFQNKISESVYTLLKSQIERFKLQHRFDVQRDKIYNIATGSEFLFYGLWRSIDEVKSLEGIDILWLEEAHNITDHQWEILEPTIRKDHSQVWVIFNPHLVSDFVWKRFVKNPPPDTVKRLINYTENGFLSKTMRKIIEAAKEEDYTEYEHIYLGVPREDDNQAVIKRSWIMAAIDAHKVLGIEPRGRKRVGFDVADDGEDKCATIYAHGSVALDSDTWKAKEDELNKSCRRVYAAARERGASITYDSIGVGAGCGANFNDMNAELKDTGRIQHEKFNAGGAVWRPDSPYDPRNPKIKNKDHFANIKAQAWWLVADRFRNTYNAVRKGEKFDDEDLICISSEMDGLEELIDELSTPKRDFDKAGRVMVESKKDLAKREVASPNRADAFIMAFAPGAAPMNINPDLLRRL